MTVTNARPSPFLQLTSDADWESIITGAGIGDGVVMNPTTSLAPTLNTGARTLDLAAGSAIVKGKLWSCDATASTAIPAASAQDRIDRLTLRLSRTAGTAAAFVQPNLIQGTPSGTPAIPAITQTTTGIWDLPICHWTSRSTGGLINLVDERFDCGKIMQSGLAANMPTWLVRPTLYYQTDTGQIWVWTGSAWSNVWTPPDSWHNMPSMANSWSIGDFAKYRFNGDGDLQVAFKNIHVGTNADSTNIWAVGSLPAAYRPPTFHRVAVWADVLAIASGTGGANAEGAGIELAADGSIQCFGFSSAATRMDCYATIPLGI